MQGRECIDSRNRTQKNLQVSPSRLTSRCATTEGKLASAGRDRVERAGVEWCV